MPMMLLLQLLCIRGHTPFFARACLPTGLFLSRDGRVMLILMHLCRGGNLRQAKGHCTC